MADPYKRDRRLGRWMVSREISDDYRTMEARKKVQDTVLVLDVRYEFMSGSFEFLGLSEHFDIAPEGELVPLYRPVIEGDLVRWERADD